MIGNRIRCRRKELGLTINDISAETKISKGNLSTLETGKSLPTSNALILLSKALRCSTDWILTGEVPNIDTTLHKSDIADHTSELSDYEELIIFMIRDLSDDDKKDVKQYIKSKLNHRHSEGLSSTSNDGKTNTVDDAVIA